MNARSIIVSVLAIVALCGVTNAQQVVVKEKPGEEQWTISYSRKHAPEVFELHTGCKTLAAAKAEAQKLIKWSNSMQANSSWRLAIIEIEGEDAQAPKADGPKLPGFGELANDFRAALNETAPVLEEYMGQIAGAYERAKQAKEGLLRMQGDVTKDVFDKVNGTIADYNKQLDTAQSSSKGASFARFPRMTPVGPEVLKKAADWRKAKEDQFALEEKKQGLDRDNDRLATERQRLIEEGREIKAEEERITSLERASASGDESAPLAGPFTLYLGQYSNTSGSKVGEFDSFQEARAAGQRHMSQNASKQPNYRITDENGARIEYDGLFGSRKVSDAQIARSASQKEGNEKSDQADLARLKDELAKRKSSRNDALSKYKSDLESYNTRLEEYEGATRAHKSRIEDLSKVAYNAPTGPSTGAPARPAASSSNPNEEVRDGIRYRRWTDGRMYPVAPDHNKLPNYRGPRWVGNNLVSP